MYTVNPELIPTDSGAYAFEADGAQIDWPLCSPCGRFQCTPEAYGFTVYQTGGGCTAWRRDFTLHGAPVYMLLTRPNEESHEISDDDGAIGVGVYAFMGDCSFVLWDVLQADISYDVVGITRGGRMPPSADELDTADRMRVAKWHVNFGFPPGTLHLIDSPEVPELIRQLGLIQTEVSRLFFRSRADVLGEDNFAAIEYERAAERAVVNLLRPFAV